MMCPAEFRFNSVAPRATMPHAFHASTLIMRRFFALFAIAVLLAACHEPAPATLHEARPLMGTIVEITAEAPEAAGLRAGVDAAYREMARLSDMMNHYNPKSVVSAINAAAGRAPVTVPPELMSVLQMARKVSDVTDGAFDITIGSLRGWRFDPEHPQMPARAAIATQLPRVDYHFLKLDAKANTAFLQRSGMRIDLGGIAKLPILHAGMRVLERHGIHSAMINGGGDIEVLGKTHGRPWHVGIRDARRPDRLYGVVSLTRGFVASSGDYERYFMRAGRRYHHILDPKTGYPTRDMHGVTLIADRLQDVNGFSAAIMVLGPKRGRELIETSAGLQGVIFAGDGSVWESPGLAGVVERPAT
jgi:thiamine biosynthesis lipoprotein